MQTIMGIDPTYYEAATVDGASKVATHSGNITIPQLSSLITVLTIPAQSEISSAFADFGLSTKSRIMLERSIV